MSGALKEYELSTVFRSLQERNFITPRGYEIWYSDVKDAVRIMNRKHYECEWVSYDVENSKNKLGRIFLVRGSLFQFKIETGRC